MTRMPFGRYRDRLLTELPDDYLNWLLSDEVTLRDPLLSDVEREVLRRELEAASQHREARRQELTPEVAAAAAEIVRRGHRLCAREAHPDTGGSTTAMVAINAAVASLREWLERVTPSEQQKQRRAG